MGGGGKRERGGGEHRRRERMDSLFVVGEVFEE